jgi:ectoine hydroxylase-related dioxygenase (phytanoyl-CoA dioxygenase family)
MGIVDGVYPGTNVRAWPLWRPRAMFEILPQILDGWHPARPRSARPVIRRVVAELDRDGVAILETAVHPDLVAHGRRDIGRLVERMPELQDAERTKPASTGGTRTYRVHEFQGRLKVYRSHDPLVFSPTYARFLLLPDVVEVVSGYLGGNWLYQAMITTRTEPVRRTFTGFDQWHHDARGRKLNVFLLLTDVAEDGPATIVLKGSHRLLYSRARRLRNFFPDADVEALRQAYGWEERICAAPAGSLIFFDSQALHRGRRSSHPRDAFQVNCMTRRGHLWPHEVSRDILWSLTPREQRTLLGRANLRVC